MEGDEGSYLPNSQTYFVIAHQELSQLFGYFSNAILPLGLI